MSPLRTRRLSAVPATVLAALIGCDASSPTATVQVSGVNVTGPADTVAVSSTLQLQATVLPGGAPQGVSWSTSDPALATVDNSGLVLGVGPGPVTITATSTAENTMSGSKLLNVTGCPAPRMVTANPTGNVTWQNWIASGACFDYVVATDVNMQSGVLTIEPGTLVAFEAGRWVRIAGTAGLIAAGTAQNTIVLTGTQPGRGHWGGVFLDNSSFNGNRVEHIIIDQAGVGPWSGSVIRANLMIVNSATTLLGATLRESAAYGLFVNATSRVAAGSGNIIERNTTGPAYAFASVVGDIVQGAPILTGNDRDVFDVMPNTIADTVTWSSRGVPFRILQAVNRLAFLVTGSLGLTASVTIEFEQDMGLIVRDGGTLTTAGGPPGGPPSLSPVLLTGAVRTPGYWRGVGMQDTNSAIYNTIIEYGGGAIIGLGEQEPANLQITTGDATTPTQVQIVGTTLRHSAGYGLYARSIGVGLVGFSQNTLTQNALGAAYVDAPIVRYLGTSTDYQGNGIARIHVNTNARPLTSDMAWRNVGVPFVLDGRGIGTPIFTVQNAVLTLDPGVEVQFDANMGLDIRNGGLNVVGDASNRIVLRPSGAAWRGIRLFESTGSLDHLTITGGGASNWGAVAHPANLVIASAGQSNAFATIGNNITSTPSSQYGLVFSFGPTVAVRCAPLGAVYVPPPDTQLMHCPSG